jgi:hypothetical protein
MKHVVKLQLRNHVITGRLNHFYYCCILIKKIAIIIPETFIHFITNTRSFYDTTEKNLLRKDQYNKSYKLYLSFSFFLLYYNKRFDDKLK